MSALFVLAAGGTGGHLFPAQALAGELMRRGRRVVVMTDGRGRHYGKAFPGAEIRTVPAATFAGRSAVGRIVALMIIGAGILAAFAKLIVLRPLAVVGFGGYPSLPVVVAAWIARVPSVLHEQNAVPGRVNRLVAPLAAAVAANLPFAHGAPKGMSCVTITGNPVRAEVAALHDAPYVAPDASGPIWILIFGGSQGAHALSETVPRALASLPETLRNRLEVTQACRAEDVAGVQTVYRDAGITCEAACFFDDLPRRMAKAHLVVARAGASTLAELTVIGRPAILVPYPYATDDHQAANAHVLERQGAAWVVRQDELEASTLARRIENILADPQALRARAAAAAAMGHADAAVKLADLVESIAKKVRS